MSTFVLSFLVSPAHAGTGSFTGPTAAAEVQAYDGCERTTAWVWSSSDLDGDTGVLVYGLVHDICTGDELEEFYGEVAGASFTGTSRSASLDASVPIEVTDTATGAVSSRTMDISIDWAGLSEKGSWDAKYYWVKWFIDYPGRTNWRRASVVATLDGDAASRVWATLDSASGTGTVTDI